jgi:hypothetical protein
MPVAISLGVIVTILSVSIGASLWATRRSRGDDDESPIAPHAKGAGSAA